MILFLEQLLVDKGVDNSNILHALDELLNKMELEGRKPNYIFAFSPNFDVIEQTLHNKFTIKRTKDLGYNFNGSPTIVFRGVTIVRISHFS